MPNGHGSNRWYTRAAGRDDYPRWRLNRRFLRLGAPSSVARVAEFTEFAAPNAARRKKAWTVVPIRWAARFTIATSALVPLN